MSSGGCGTTTTHRQLGKVWTVFFVYQEDNRRGGLLDGHLSRLHHVRALALQPRSRYGGVVEVDETALHRACPPHRRGQEGLESKSDQTHPSGHLPQVRKQVRAHTPRHSFANQGQDRVHDLSNIIANLHRRERQTPRVGGIIGILLARCGAWRRLFRTPVLAYHTGVGAHPPHWPSPIVRLSTKHARWRKRSVLTPFFDSANHQRGAGGDDKRGKTLTRSRTFDVPGERAVVWAVVEERWTHC